MMQMALISPDLDLPFAELIRNHFQTLAINRHYHMYNAGNEDPDKRFFHLN